MKEKQESFILKLHIVLEFFGSLWKYKLWWGVPIIMILFFLMLFLLVAGHTGVAAFIYPLF